MEVAGMRYVRSIIMKISDWFYLDAFNIKSVTLE